jgi:hypothetical protein
MNENAKRRKFFALFGIVAALLAVQWSAMSVLRPTPEKAIRAALHGMAAKAAGMDVAGVVSFVSEDYRGEVGADRGGLEKEIASAFGELKSLSASVEFSEILVKDDKARAVALVRVSGEFNPNKGHVYPRFVGLGGGLKPDAVYLEFRLEGEGWRVDLIDWKVDGRLKDFPAAEKKIKG